ncbi:MAG: glycosyltransferase [Syntrophothermus sp.]
MEERQNAEQGNSNSSQQGNQPDKEPKPQQNQPEKPEGHRGEKPQSEKPQGDRSQEEKPQGDRQQGDRPRGDRRPFRGHDQRGGNRPQGNRPQGGRPQRGESQQTEKQQGEGPQGEKPQSEKPHSERPQSDRPQDERQSQEKSPVQKPQQEKHTSSAVNKILPPKTPKKVPYNRYRTKPYYGKREETPQSASAQQAAAPKKTQFRKISIVVPLFNEEESLRPLANEIKKAMRLVAADFEVILVDDGSTDKSLSIIKEIARSDSKFKFISFRKNYGKSAALQVGFRQATGDAIITMDADLQDDPNEIPNLIGKLEEGYDLVSGWKKERYDPFIKRQSSKFFNFVTGVMSGIKIHDFNCGLKAYRKEVVRDLKVYGELHRYMPVLADWQGYSISEVAVKHHPRRYGKTKFGISRFFKGFIDLVTVIFTTRYIKRPMHLFGFLGALSFLVGFLVNGYLTYEKLMLNKSVSNRPLLFLGMLLIIVGVQFFSVGLLGEMMVHNSQSDREYSIKDKG